MTTTTPVLRDKKALSIPLALWAREAFDQDSPDCDDYQCPEVDLYEEEENLIEYYGVSPDHIEDVINFLDNSLSEAVSTAVELAWLDAVEAATDHLFLTTNHKTFNPFVASFDEPAMLIPKNFPDLDYEIIDYRIEFYGSLAPLHARMVAALFGVAEYSSISDFRDDMRTSGTDWDGVPSLISLFRHCTKPVSIDGNTIENHIDWDLATAIEDCCSLCPEYFQE